MDCLPEARVALERALAVVESRDDPEHPSLAESLTSMAITQLALAQASWLADHDREGARSLAKSALDQLERDPVARSGVLLRDLEEMRWMHEAMD